MGLGRTMSPEVAERFAADRELASELRGRLAAAEETERSLRAAQVERRPEDEQRRLAVAYNGALVAAIAAAEAAERVAMGPKTYEYGDAKQRRAAQIAARKARATAKVRPLTNEVDRLRTLREQHKLTFRTGPGVAA